MWSLGCILAELLTGYALFPGEDERDQLACIIELLDLPPPKLLEQSKRAKNFFTTKGYPRYCSVETTEDGRVILGPGTSRQGKERGPPGSKSLKKALKGCDDPLFLNFLAGCLEWDPEIRMTPATALKHAWFRRRLPRPPLTYSNTIQSNPTTINDPSPSNNNGIATNNLSGGNGVSETTAENTNAGNTVLSGTSYKPLQYISSNALNNPTQNNNSNNLIKNLSISNPNELTETSNTSNGNEKSNGSTSDINKSLTNKLRVQLSSEKLNNLNSNNHRSCDSSSISSLASSKTVLSSLQQKIPSSVTTAETQQTAQEQPEQPQFLARQNSKIYNQPSDSSLIDISSSESIISSIPTIQQQLIGNIQVTKLPQADRKNTMT